MPWPPSPRNTALNHHPGAQPAGDYTQEDIAALCQHPTFAYTWEEYLGGGTRTVGLTEFWDIWSRKWDYETQGVIADRPMMRYGDDAYRGVDITETLLETVRRRNEEND